MAIVFPASPSVNDTFTAGSITYKWDGDKWIGLGVTPADRLIEGSNSLEITAGNDLVWTGDGVGLGTPTPNSACKLEVKGTSDGVLHLNTTDARGSFIRFQENDTTKAWVGCAEGLITGTDQDDLGLRATDNIVFRAGSSESARFDANGRLIVGNSTATITEAKIEDFYIREDASSSDLVKIAVRVLIFAIITSVIGIIFSLEWQRIYLIIHSVINICA